MERLAAEDALLLKEVEEIRKREEIEKMDRREKKRHRIGLEREERGQMGTEDSRSSYIEDKERRSNREKRNKRRSMNELLRETGTVPRGPANYVPFAGWKMLDAVEVARRKELALEAQRRRSRDDNSRADDKQPLKGCTESKSEIRENGKKG